MFNKKKGLFVTAVSFAGSPCLYCAAVTIRPLQAINAVRKICVNELCIIMHGDAIRATDALVSLLRIKPQIFPSFALGTL